MPPYRGLIWFEDSPRRIRAVFAGETVVDSTHAKLLHEHGHLPVYYFPEEDVRMDLLEPSDTRTGCAYKGFASYWSLRLGDELEEDVIWTYREPTRDAARIKGRLAFFNERVELTVSSSAGARPR